MLLPNPQLSGSFAAPSMQVPDNELAGNAQLVKSALICEPALLPGVEQRAESAMIIDSLEACCAQVSAHTGGEFAADKPHSVREFCIIALHITVVVKRA